MHENENRTGSRGSGTLIDRIIGSNTAIVIIALLGIAMGLFIVWGTSWANSPIPREDAAAYSGKFLAYRAGEDSGTVVFVDGTEHVLHASTETPELRARMEALEEGTALHLLIHPQSDLILEVRTDGEELLNFDAAQEALRENDVVGIVAGWILAALGAFLILFVILRRRDERLETARHSEKTQGRAVGENDAPLRPADELGKGRILLEARVGAYQICYRRVRHVNELVVNGSVYDEKRGILEFAHSLTAVIDGHTVEAGLDRNDFSYILFDGELIVNCLRLV